MLLDGISPLEHSRLGSSRDLSFKVLDAVRDIGSNQRAFNLIFEFWATEPQLLASAARGSLEAKLSNYLYNTLIVAVWEWLDLVVNAAIATLDDAGQPTEETWYSKLAAAIFRFHFLSIRNQEYVDSEHFLPPDFVRLSSSRYQLKRRLGRLTRDQALSATREVLFDVLREWTSFPADAQSRCKAQFLKAILTHSSSAILYLDVTSTSLQHISTKVLGKRRSYAFNSTSITPFIQQLIQHPISDPKSNEYGLLQQIGVVYTDVYGHQVPSIQPSLPPAGRSLFVAFLRTLLSVINETGVPGGGELAKKVAMNPDRYLPFRERAPSRVKSREDPSPFSASNLRTRAGFFSATVIRAVTFSAPVLVHDGRAFFNDLKSWTAMRAQVTDDRYLADITAMGTPCQTRHPDTVPILWTNSHAWEALVADRSTFPAVDFFHFLYGGPKRVLNVHGLGRLGAYLLTADYVYAGLVDMPSVSDMAYFINTIKGGALAGLQSVGLLPSDRFDESHQSVLAALRSLNHYVLQSFTDEELDLMGYDIIMLEHALCKFRRLHIASEASLL